MNSNLTITKYIYNNTSVIIRAMLRFYYHINKKDKFDNYSNAGYAMLVCIDVKIRCYTKVYKSHTRTP